MLNINLITLVFVIDFGFTSISFCFNVCRIVVLNWVFMKAFEECLGSGIAAAATGCNCPCQPENVCGGSTCCCCSPSQSYLAHSSQKEAWTAGRTVPRALVSRRNIQGWTRRAVAQLGIPACFRLIR